MNQLFAGIDLGGTNLRIAVQDQQGLSLGEFSEKLHDRDPEKVVQKIAAVLDGFCSDTRKIVIASALAAMLSKDGTKVVNAPNLGWFNFPFASKLQKALKQPSHIFLFNDLKAATYGEYVAGAGQGFQNIVCVFVGSGVGSGFVLDGKLQQGAHRVAGEFGHIKVETKQGRLCGCKAKGCLEAYLGGHNITKILKEYAEKGTSAYLRTVLTQQGSRAFSPKLLEEGARRKDPVCLELLEQSAEKLGLALANLLTLLDPDCLILGGGVLQNSPLLFDKTKTYLKKFGTTPGFQSLQITKAKLGDNAGLIGALELSRKLSATL